MAYMFHDWLTKHEDFNLYVLPMLIFKTVTQGHIEQSPPKVNK